MSIDANFKKRLCCHDLTAETEEINEEILREPISYSSISQKVIEAFNKGEIPKNCISCIELEKKNIRSPRQEYISKFAFSPSSKLISYLDYTVDNHCNFKCRSCRPEYSKPLEADFEKLNIPFEKVLDNYDQRSSLHETIITKLDKAAMITLTGGEPLISPNVKDFLNQLVSLAETKDMKLRFFTNLSVIPSWLEETIQSFYKIELIVSLDAVDDLANYLRYPSKWTTIKKNLEKVSKLTKLYDNLEVSVHCVMQAFNLSHIPRMLEALRAFENSIICIPTVTLLEHPTMYRVNNLPAPYLEKYKKRLLDYINSYQIINNKFSEPNTKNLQDLKELASSMQSDGSELLVALTHAKKLDKIRGQSLFEIIPDLKELNETSSP